MTSFIEPFWKKREQAIEQSVTSLHASVRTSQRNPFQMTLRPSGSKLLNVGVKFGRTRICEPSEIEKSVRRQQRRRNLTQLSSHLAPVPQDHLNPMMLATFNDDEQRMHETFRQLRRPLPNRTVRYKSASASSDSDFDNKQGFRQPEPGQQGRKHLSGQEPTKALPSLRYSPVDAGAGGQEGQRMYDKLSKRVQQSRVFDPRNKISLANQGVLERRPKAKAKSKLAKKAKQHEEPVLAPIQAQRRCASELASTHRDTRASRQDSLAEPDFNETSYTMDERLAMHQKLQRRGSFRKSKRKLPVRDENAELGLWAGQFDVDPILRKVREATTLPPEVGPLRDHYREFDEDLRSRASYATSDVN